MAQKRPASKLGQRSRPLAGGPLERLFEAVPTRIYRAIAIRGRCACSPVRLYTPPTPWRRIVEGESKRLPPVQLSGRVPAAVSGEVHNVDRALSARRRRAGFAETQVGTAHEAFGKIDPHPESQLMFKLVGS